MTSVSRMRYWGGVLLIVGTTIGGGMLALPISNAEAALPLSSVYLFLIWAVMTLSALFLLEVNLSLPAGANLISMAQATLGKPGKIVMWVVYCFLLYSLLAAYIAGGTDVLGEVLQVFDITLPHYWVVGLFLAVTCPIIVMGIRSVDNVNKVLMILKLSVYLLLVMTVMPYAHVDWLTQVHPTLALHSWMLLVVSFGYAIIIPSLRVYFNDDVVSLRQAVLVGSFIPLVCYLVWDAAIMGVVPRSGIDGLMSMMYSGQATVHLTQALDRLLSLPFDTQSFRAFTSICMLTAFLAVGLSLTDFIADGIGVDKTSKRGWIVYALTFLPPVALVLMSTNLFLQGLSFAGLVCVILLIWFPLLMVISKRYYLGNTAGYRVCGGKWTVYGVGVCAILLAVIGVLYPL